MSQQRKQQQQQLRALKLAREQQQELKGLLSANSADLAEHVLAREQKGLIGPQRITRQSTKQRAQEKVNDTSKIKSSTTRAPASTTTAQKKQKMMKMIASSEPGKAMIGVGRGNHHRAKRTDDEGISAEQRTSDGGLPSSRKAKADEKKKKRASEEDEEETGQGEDGVGREASIGDFEDDYDERRRDDLKRRKKMDDCDERKKSKSKSSDDDEDDDAKKKRKKNEKKRKNKNSVFVVVNDDDDDDEDAVKNDSINNNNNNKKKNKKKKSAGKRESLLVSKDDEDDEDEDDDDVEKRVSKKSTDGSGGEKAATTTDCGDEAPQDVSMMHDDNDDDDDDEDEDIDDVDPDDIDEDEEDFDDDDDNHDDNDDDDDDDDEEDEEEYSDDDDDDNSDDEEERAHRERQDGGLHALLSRLGGSVEALGGGSRSGISARLKDILKALTFNRESEDFGGIDDTAIVIALNELCEIVVTSSEELLATSLSPEPFALALINCCNLEHNPELMLLAVRAMTSMADILPNTRGAFVRNGALATLCQKLFAIEYIDVAEQSLSALEKLTRGYYGAKAAEAGALTAALAHLDFFGVGMQGVSMQMAANVCAEFPTKSLSIGAVDAIPTLLSLLTRDDKKVASLACTCLVSLSLKAKKLADRRIQFLRDAAKKATTTTTTTTIATATSTATATAANDTSIRQKKKKEKSSTESMDPVAVNKTVSLILSDALCERCLEIIREAAGNSNTESVTNSRLLYRGCVKIIATILEARPEMSVFLLKNGIAQILAEHLERCKIVRASVEVSEYSPLQSMDDLHDAIGLLWSLLPQQGETNVDKLEVRKLFSKAENLQLIAIFGEYLVPTLCHVAESPSDVTIKRKALSTLASWTYLVDFETFERVAKEEAPIAAVIARSLIDPQGDLLREAAKLCAVALEKSSSIDESEEESEFIKRFAKEGGAHALEVRTKEYNFLISEASEKIAPSEKTLVQQTTTTTTTTTTTPTMMMQMVTNPKEDGLRMCSEVRNTYFGPGKAHLIASEGLDRLRKACAKLKAAPLSDASSKSAMNPRDARDFSSAFAKIFEALATSEISAFELSECGAASTLRKFLCSTESPAETKSKSKIDAALTVDCEEATERLAIFARAAGDAPNGAFETLVRLLVETLQTRERLPISVSEHISNSDSSRSRDANGGVGSSSLVLSASASGDLGLNLLARPLKVRLKRASKCDANIVEDYGNAVVMIEPLAQLSAIEAFLWSRVKKQSARSTPTPSNNIAATAAAAATEGAVTETAGGANAPTTAPDATAPADETTDRAREMDEEEEDEFNEEDYDDMDEDDMDDMDEEDYMDEEEDEENLLGPEGENHMSHPPASVRDISTPPPSTSAQPHEQQELQQQQAPPPTSAAAAAARSFASVAASIDASRPRLAFSVNDGESFIPDIKNVLAAVTQVSIGDGIKPLSGRLWEQPCIIYYDIVDKKNPKFEGIISDPSAESSGVTKDDESSAIGKLLEQNLFANPSIKSGVKALLGPVATTVFSVQFGSPKIVAGLEDEAVRDALATLTLCHLVTEDSKKILRTAGPETATGTKSEMLSIDEDAEENMLLSADRMRVANISSVKRNVESLFLAPKISGKLRTQLRDTLSVCARRVPEWTSVLARTCPWLLTLEERVLLFHCSSFSVARALHQLHGDANAGGNGGGDPRAGARVGRLQRQKVRIKRDHALASAMKVFASPLTLKHVLEVEFYEEVGTGIGPTNEFYALFSKDLQKSNLGIFRSENTNNTNNSKVVEDDELVNCPHGLFPKPLRPTIGANSLEPIEIFRCVGRAIGKVLQDGRLLDCKFNPNFFKKLLGLPLGLDDLELIEPELFSTLKKLETAVRDGSGRVDGAKIEDLCLEFALPDGARIPSTGAASVDILDPYPLDIVTQKNAMEYINAVVDDILGKGVEPLFKACREGFSDVVSDPSNLAIFTVAEIDMLTCGMDEQTKWTDRDLREHILCDHGYQVNSKPVVNLREILVGMTDVERRSFLKFTTGSPRLPVGGLASLKPKLKVVCKQPTILNETGGGMNSAEMVSEGTELADGDLPSAMTCANYLKLPPYSTKLAMENKLKLAITEGVGSFDLS